MDGKTTGSLGSRQLAALRARKIGFIFQTFNLLPVLTALENVEYPLLIHGGVTGNHEEIALAALTRVGLESHAGHRPAQLSGGQRQRVAVARALVKRPAIIIADEPTANLDKKTAVDLIDLLHRLNREDGVTVVFASHDPLVLERARRVVHISDGQLADEDAPC